jgi:hypothetical protein
LGFVLCAAGCFGESATPFPPGLAPLEANRAPAPAADPGNPFPEKLVMIHGSGAYDWVHARAYVDAPLRLTWAALSDPNVTADPKIKKMRLEVLNEPAYACSYVLHYTVDDFITVHFDVTWRHGLVSGTKEMPTMIAARFQKTNGTDFIDLLEGSVVAYPVSDQATEIELIEHLDATATGPDEIERYFRAYYANVLRRVREIDESETLTGAALANR